MGIKEKTLQREVVVKDYLTPTTWHIYYSASLCSCGQRFEFETDLIKHIGEHLPEEVKEKQFDLFEK